MGALYLFTCTCGYSAEVSGGPDVGMTTRTVTISCATCKQLSDVVTSNEPWKQPPDPVPEHPKCPRSRTKVHATSVWSHPGACPQCGKRMRKGAVTMLWD